jgi:hypothetical protein
VTLDDEDYYCARNHKAASKIFGQHLFRPKYWARDSDVADDYSGHFKRCVKQARRVRIVQQMLRHGDDAENAFPQTQNNGL